VDIGSHASNTHEDLSGLAVSGLHRLDLRSVDHVVQLGVVLEDRGGARDVEGLSVGALVEELAHGAIID
jgi:hypothetical protein